MEELLRRRSRAARDRSRFHPSRSALFARYVPASAAEFDGGGRFREPTFIQWISGRAQVDHALPCSTQDAKQPWKIFPVGTNDMMPQVGGLEVLHRRTAPRRPRAPSPTQPPRPACGDM